jgi:predicted aspartyl protease
MFKLSQSAVWSAAMLLVMAGSACVAQEKAAGGAAVTAGEPDLSQGESRFDPAVAAGLEVKKVKTGHLLVRPVVNGKAAGWFIFDTGAGICVISTPKKDELGLVDAGELDAVGVGGAAKTRLYRAERVQLGPMTMRNHPVMLTDLSFLTPHLGEEISGVIGYGVLSQCVAEFSIADATISLHDPKTYALREGAGAWEEMKIIERVPRIHANVEGNDGLFRIDTGANSSITLHEPAVRKWKMLEGRETTQAKLGGVGGFVKARRGSVKDVTLGGVRHEDVKAEFAVEAKGTFAKEAIDGNIGAGLLSKYTMVLDYAGQRICLRARDVKEGEGGTIGTEGAKP